MTASDAGADYHASSRAGRNQSWMWSTEEPQPWKNDGACRESEVNFFPGRGHGPEVEAAKKVCQGCPVLDECRAYGLHEKFGIWGGMSERQRRTARKVLGIRLPVERMRPKRERKAS